MFEPWKGSSYVHTRLLILGESTYDWQENEIWFTPRPDHCTELVTKIIKNLDGPNFMKTVSRGLANDEILVADRLKYVWDHVAFTNYVPVSVGRPAAGERLRPSPEQWSQARNEFKFILEELKPLRIVVLGLTMWESMPTTNYGDGKGAQAYRLSTRELCWCVPLQHPARGLNWRTLAAAVYFYDGNILMQQPERL